MMRHLEEVTAHRASLSEEVKIFLDQMIFVWQGETRQLSFDQQAEIISMFGLDPNEYYIAVSTNSRSIQYEPGGMVANQVMNGRTYYICSI